MKENFDTPITPYEAPESLPGREAVERAFVSIDTELAGLTDEATLEAMKESGGELIETFALSPELFDSRVRTFLFAAIAKRASEMQPDDRAGWDFIADATTLLALEHSGRYGEVKDMIDSDEGDGPERAAVYEKFTDHALTGEMEQLIRDGYLDTVRQRLGVAADNEDPYEVRVLDLGDEASLLNMRPSYPQEPSESTMATYEADREAYESYKAAMLANMDAFVTELGIGGRVPPAWNTQVDGKTVLCLPSPTAKMLLNRDAIKKRRTDQGDQSDEARLAALVEHEYAHTQGGVAVDKNVFYGITAEEVRVENASGNKHGYLDAKVFMRQVAVLGGFNATEYFDNNGKNSSEHFFMDMASVVGLDAMLEIALVPPAQYVEDSRIMHKAVNEYLGGYNGVLTRLYENTKDAAATRQRMEEFKDRMREFPPHVREGWLASQAGGNQMPLVANLYEDIMTDPV